ncbi:MAG: MBL fold metallo-hydrolase [Succinivibrionaceae bacterium]
MKLGFAGGAQEVGGSCICLRIGDYGILLDSGIRQGASKDPLPDFRLIQEMGGIDVILISHAHMDHIGSLPLISRAYPDAPIYMTPMTMDLTRVLLQDSLKIMSIREEEIPLYGEQDVVAMMNRIIPLHEQVEKEILPSITVVFYPAGHIAGAACTYLKTPEGSIFYSGDFAAFSQQTIEGIHIPRLRPDVCIVESTYGDRLHSNRQVEENRLISLIAEAVTEGRKVLIPSFALGRSQEVIMLIRSGMNKGLIPQVPVYVDGMVREICRIYRFHPTCLKNKLAKSIMKGFDPFYSKEVQPVLPSADRRELLEKPGAAVFVASSGMLSGGPSVLYAEKIISCEDGLIILTGYQDEEAPGRALMQLAESANLVHSTEGNTDEVSFVLNGRSIPVKARVCKVGLSAHGDQEEILSLLTSLSPRDIFLVHGDANAIPSLARMITGEHLREVHIPRCGEVSTVSYMNTRKQYVRNWTWTLKETEQPDEEGLAKLRQFVLEHYPERQWTAIQLMEIWYGRSVSDQFEIISWQKLLMDSPNFTSGDTRMFLFHPSSDEELEVARKPKQANLQEIQDLAAKYFSFLEYKKAGMHVEDKKVVLRFLFPDAVNMQAFETASKGFAAETGWTAAIHPAPNHHSMLNILQTLLGNRIIKFSYFEADRYYQAYVRDNTPDDMSIKEKFKSVTGWSLELICDNSLNTAGSPVMLSTQDFKDVSDNVPKEQNVALSYIKGYCAEKSIPLQKQGIKTDQEGKYIEMTFITPEIGRQYAEQIDELSKAVGWRIVLSSSVMQNLVLSQASQIAAKAGLILSKGPSYMPSDRLVQLKATGSDPDTVQSVIKKITEKTGLHCKVLFS